MIAATARARVSATFANTEAADSITATAHAFDAVKVSFIEPADVQVASGNALVKGSLSKTSSDTAAAAAQALIKATLAATEPNDVGAARLNDGRVAVVEAGDGVAATGTASQFSWQITHYTAP
jgi:hypothetical protein